MIVIYPSLGANDGWSWQFVTAIHDDRDGQKLCEQVSRLYQQSSWCYLKCFVAEISLQSSWIRWKDRFRVQRSQERSYEWNVGFRVVRGAALPGNTLGAPCIFEAHARACIYGDRLLGSSSEAAALRGRAPTHHASSL
jgi:hypothetical protein